MSFDKEQFKQEMDEQIKEAVSLVFESKIKEKMAEEKDGAYEKFMKAALKKFGVESPDELDKEKKKEFFDYVDKNWESDEEEEEGETVKESDDEDDKSDDEEEGESDDDESEEDDVEEGKKGKK